MKIKILFFASSRDLVGAKEKELTVEEGMSVGALKEYLLGQYPRLQPLKKVLSIAVNAEYTGDDTVIKPGDEVALIPPVSGG